MTVRKAAAVPVNQLLLALVGVDHLGQGDATRRLADHRIEFEIVANLDAVGPFGGNRDRFGAGFHGDHAGVAAGLLPHRRTVGAPGLQMVGVVALAAHLVMFLGDKIDLHAIGSLLCALDHALAGIADETDALGFAVSLLAVVRHIEACLVELAALEALEVSERHRELAAIFEDLAKCVECSVVGGVARAAFEAEILGLYDQHLRVLGVGIGGATCC